MNDRTCIVTRMTGEPDTMIRFVAGPDGAVVPDLKRNLPGRGCWVTGMREMVDRAVGRKLFGRALNAAVQVDPELGLIVDRLLAKAALGSLGLARKAGNAVLGAAKVETAVRSGKALAVLHAADASPDGVRKTDQARRAVVHQGGPDIAAFKLFSQAEMSLALGGANVIHAALLAGPAGDAALKRLVTLRNYRNDSAEGGRAVAPNGKAS